MSSIGKKTHLIRYFFPLSAATLPTTSPCSRFTVMSASPPSPPRKSWLSNPPGNTSGSPLLWKVSPLGNSTARASATEEGEKSRRRRALTAWSERSGEEDGRAERSSSSPTSSFRTADELQEIFV